MLSTIHMWCIKVFHGMTGTKSACMWLCGKIRREYSRFSYLEECATEILAIVVSLDGNSHVAIFNFLSPVIHPSFPNQCSHT